MRRCRLRRRKSHSVGRRTPSRFRTAYWGENLIAWGADGTASQQPMGGLPAAGQWVRLEVPASLVGLEGRTLSGMNFILYNGRATWDYTGKSSP